MKPFTIEHKKRLKIAQTKAWDDGRRIRRKLGSIRVKNGLKQIFVKSQKGWKYWRNLRPKGFYTKEEIKSLPSHIRYWLRKKGYNIPLRKSGAPLGCKRSEKTKAKMRESQVKYRSSGKVKWKDTKIEQKIEQELKRRDIYYQKQVALCKVTVVDFYLPQSRTVIYCDGDYWHRTKEVKSKDINQDVILTFNGFNVYRFTETEINKSAKRCINKVFRDFKKLNA